MGTQDNRPYTYISREKFLRLTGAFGFMAARADPRWCSRSRRV
ncbi:hypothetical protein BH23ACT11_BH23ACT11_28520 [soil metagenome]